MDKKTKALIYNLIGFAIFFLTARFLVIKYSNLTNWWIPLTAFVIATILAPKFQTVRTNEGEKLFMKWLFIKGVKEIK